jgi:SAM-dependent methyltransferase
LWGKSEDPGQPFYSGSGSHDKNITSVYLEKVWAFLQNFPKAPDVVDLGCGDFSVGSQIRRYCNNYVACDVVPQLIEHNKNKYKDLNVDFRTLNLITDPLPAADIVFIRQVLQHLSNQQILKLIPKLQASYSYLVLTEHLPKSNTFPPNIDKPAGPDIRLPYNSGIVLTKPPFNLQIFDEQLMCEAEEQNGVIRTTKYMLKQ